MIMNEQCDFADGICNGQEFSKVPLMNWGTQPQVFRKGTVIGHLEQASIATYDDPIWKDYWEELPYSGEGIVRICQSKNRLEQLQQQIKISDRCSETERQQLLECLLGKSEVFALSDEELGETNVVEHSIDTSMAKPVKEPPRRLPYALRKQLEEELDKLLKINCVEPAISPYASPLVLVRKPDGNLRVCVDYRSVNKDTIPDRYPLPRMDELIDSIGSQKAVYFTKLDLMRGYYQVKMAEESKEKTAFICHRGLYQFRRMPFGLTNAPATFQRLMERLFAGWDFVFIYLDDILIASRREYAWMNKIKQLPTSPGHPQCDGLVERFNRTLKSMLSKLVENKGRDWDRLLGPVLFAYRTTPHSSTGETPFYLLYGRDAKLPSALDFYSPCPRTAVIYSEYGKTLFRELKQIRDIAKKSIQQTQKSQKKQYDKSSHPVTVEAGDTVFVKVQPKFKLDRTYHGPYRVYEATTSTNVKVKPVTTPDVEAITISLQQVSKCKGNFLANQFWYGHSVTRPRNGGQSKRGTHSLQQPHLL